MASELADKGIAAYRAALIRLSPFTLRLETLDKKHHGAFPMKVWLVRAGRHGEYEMYNLDNNIVSIGWREIPSLSKVDTKADMRKLLEKHYPDRSRSFKSNNLGQLWSFKERIDLNDIVVLPLKTQSAIALGKVTGDYEYKQENPEGSRHTRKVEWIKTDLPRDVFGQDLLYSFGAFMTVCRISRNNAEERIKSIIDTNTDSHLAIAKASTINNNDNILHEIEMEEEDIPPQDLEQYSLDLIRKYISAKFGGHHLTKLVTAILKAQGYYTHMSPAGPDGGVDIMAGSGPMGFDHPRLCVQVKSVGNPVDVPVLRELQGVMKNFGADHGLLVSWGGFKNSVFKEARTIFFEIRLWDSDSLIQALLENYGKLSDEIQAEIPLKRIWTLVPEEEE